MPFMRLTTTKTLTLQQEVAFKEAVGRLMNLFGKSEEHLMIHIEDNQVMYFKGKEIECMKVDIQLFHHIDINNKKEFVKKISYEIEKITAIPQNHQYISLQEMDCWGMNGELYE